MEILNNTTIPEEENNYERLYGEIKKLCHLEIENARLLLVEKLTLLLGRITLAAVSFVVCTAALIFLSMSVADFLLRGLEPCWTYLIVSGFYVLIVVIVACFRRRLIVDPIARYISRVILDPPAAQEQKSASTAVVKSTSPNHER